jgi:hypothetical protein
MFGDRMELWTSNRWIWSTGPSPLAVCEGVIFTGTVTVNSDDQIILWDTLVFCQVGVLGSHTTGRCGVSKRFRAALSSEFLFERLIHVMRFPCEKDTVR